MTRTISLTESTRELGLDPVFRASPLIITGSSISGTNTYRAQLWRRPQDARETDAEPLATAYGIAASGSISLAFSGTAMDITLAADGGRYDDLWLTLAGVQTDGQIVAQRAGWLRVEEGGNDPSEFVIDGVVVTVVDDVATFTIDGVLYSIPVVPTDEVSPGTTGWLVSVVNDVLILSRGSETYAAPVTQQ